MALFGLYTIEIKFEGISQFAALTPFTVSADFSMRFLHISQFPLTSQFMSAGINIDYDEEVSKKAIQWSLQRGNRTGRTAWQFILNIASDQNLKIKIYK